MLASEQKKKVRERIYKRFKRRAERIGKPNQWKQIEIDGKTYEDALEFELRKEEDLAKKGEESRLSRSREFDPEKIQGFTRKRKDPLDWLANPCDKRGSHAPECACNKCMGGFGDEDLIEPTGETDEERAERKEFEREYNAELEREATKNICPVCRSSVCHCGED